jgi:putative membrane protein
MIIAQTPKFRILFVEVWRVLALLFIWDSAVTIFYYILPFDGPELPITLFGTAVALFLGFRSNSAYQRWWEARILWGGLVNASRNLARLALTNLNEGAANVIIDRQIVYANMVGRSLRGQPPIVDIALSGEIRELEKAANYRAPSLILLASSAHVVADERHAGNIDTVVQGLFVTLLNEITNIQGGLERIKNTPMPLHYRFLPAVFTRLFCALLPFGLVENLGAGTPIGSTVASLMFLAALQIGDDLSDPFANSVHDVPVSALCRVIEIDMLELAGRESPPVMQPHNGAIW